ncbi:MAG: phenylalanine--tRNA ligase subunit alpha [Elusimicrobiota bacterium]
MITKKYADIENNASSDIRSCSDPDSLREIKARYLGRSGQIALLFREMSTLSKKEKPLWGKKLNDLKSSLDTLVKEREAEFSEMLRKDISFDPTLPIQDYGIPGTHPINKVQREIVDIFSAMGFDVAYGPEIETNYNNFTALNFPEDHPARDMHDTLYLKKEGMLMRTHTSPVQIRMMNMYSPPYKFVAPGKCYRRDTIDASHSPVFHQVEGLMVDKDISFADLKGILDEFASRIFSEDTTTRFRPSFFPFTEPSAEMDIACGLCKGKGCPSCSGKGWLEILGAGMVDPEVFGHCGINAQEWQGFAFGMGVERIAMLKYNITDMRLFYQNDLRFLEQF